MSKLKEPPLIADTVLTIAERKDLAFTLAGPLRHGCPIPSTSPRVGYVTSREHADALLAALERHYAGVPGVFHYRLPHTEKLIGWKSTPGAIPMIIDFRNHQFVNAAGIDEPRPTITDPIRRKLADIVDGANRELGILTLTAADELDPEGLANIALQDRDRQIIVGWPAWSFLSFPTDMLVTQACRFVRSVAEQ